MALSAMVGEPLASVVGEVRTVFQPVAGLADNALLGWEALTRGDPRRGFESPERMFAAARRAGLTVELDWACQAQAIRSALDADLPRQTALFLNVEPETAGRDLPPGLASLIVEASRHLQVIFEITERALADHGAGVVAGIRRARSLGALIAVDDVGAEPASLALLPLLDPDVVKLDLGLVQSAWNDNTADIVNAVVAHAERTGAMVLAEGIETEEHRLRAAAFGAGCGQGWLLGRPGPLPAAAPVCPVPFARPTPVLEPGHDPFDVAAEARPVLTAPRRFLNQMSRYLENHALRHDDPVVVISGFQNFANVTAGTWERYGKLADRAAMTAMMATDADLADVPATAARVTIVPVDHHEPMADEWVLIVLGVNFAGAIIGRDLGDQKPRPEQRFKYVLTYDRQVVTVAGLTLLDRIAQAAHRMYPSPLDSTGNGSRDLNEPPRPLDMER